MDGYIEHTSGINLGLHEMAHALYLENKILNSDYNFFDIRALKAFQSISEKVVNSPKYVEGDLFRRYSITDQHEFFAVAVENFFEKPQEFRQQKPELYRIMCELLKQNPAEL